jgi:hypothetical protein
VLVSQVVPAGQHAWHWGPTQVVVPAGQDGTPPHVVGSTKAVSPAKVQKQAMKEVGGQHEAPGLEQMPALQPQIPAVQLALS